MKPENSILTPFQGEIFLALSRCSYIRENFYFSGGTALSECYLKHRISEDLDFFTQKKVAFSEIRIELEEVFKKLGISSLEYREELSAKLFFLRKPGREVIKTDFNYFPFKRLNKGNVFLGIEVDDIFDIAVNKLHAILTRENGRDFVDFYFIQKEKNYDFGLLLKGLNKKFLWKVDPVFLGSRLIKIKKEVTDYPKMLVSFTKKEMIDFYLRLSLEQGKMIFKD